ncbi:hypothetical protein [Streptomyces wuyuanensis]|uniref:hypothetical protein n=1 Tax=Streptomyces wuyuanensis TaxID=1196353 RepID=UPI0037FA44E7
MTFSTGEEGIAVIACEAGAGFGEVSPEAAAKATEEVAAAPRIVALAATTDMSLRPEPFKMIPFN